MNFDFTISDHPDGYLLAANSDDAKDWVFRMFDMLADPILTQDGVTMASIAIGKTDLSIQDCRGSANSTYG